MANIFKLLNTLRFIFHFNVVTVDLGTELNEER